MAAHDIIVVGASAGGVSALVQLVANLPADFDGSIFIVLHIPAQETSKLPEILSASGALKAVHPYNGEYITKGKIYVAPNNQHLLLEDGKIVVKYGPKESRFIPSIDALFCSAAYRYKERVVGIILSGMLDDGVFGLWTIKRLGGITIIQSPKDAMQPGLPENALAFIKPDFMVRSSEISAVLVNLCKEINMRGIMQQTYCSQV